MADRFPEIQVHCIDGKADSANSEIRIPAAKSGSARNLNTVAQLMEMASSG